MKKINSKAKGSGFERDIAKKISLLLTNGEKNDTVWRSISSGSFATNKKKKGEKSEHSVGDLMSVSEESKIFFDIFNVECKNYKLVDLYHILTDNSIIIDWYEKLYNDSSFNKLDGWMQKHSLIIFKQKFKPILCVTDYNIFEYMLIRDKFNIKIDHIKFLYKKENQNLCLFKFDDLLNAPDFNNILRNYRDTIYTG